MTQPRFSPQGWRDRALAQGVLHLGARLRVGTLTLCLPDGQIHRFQGTQAEEPHAEVEFRSSAGLRRLLFGGDIGFAESYVDGEWRTPDLLALMHLARSNETVWRNGLQGSALARWINRLSHRCRPNSRRGSRRNIARHYDLGNAFYALWLDRGMTYSSAMYQHEDQDLSDAQTAKYQHIARLAGVQSARSVLEIGCGWGGFLEHAARIGCRVGGITLSREQLVYANRRMRAAGLAGRAHASLTDYRDSRGQYDAVVSIEMLEAVGEEHWPRYFQILRERLKPGAAAVVQVITIDDRRFAGYRRRADFIQRHIFPGGMLPCPAVLREQALAAGLTPDHEERFGASYARTLSAWRRRLIAAWPDIERLGFDARFRRLWEYYLCYCETGFRTGSIDVGIYRFRRTA
jgi:cyclopropane-fatty-acyl-phospholipid synthase